MYDLLMKGDHAMDHQQFFARYEVKYLMSKSQKKELQQEMEPHMQAAVSYTHLRAHET